MNLLPERKGKKEDWNEGMSVECSRNGDGGWRGESVRKRGRETEEATREKKVIENRGTEKMRMREDGNEKDLAVITFNLDSHS